MPSAPTGDVAFAMPATPRLARTPSRRTASRATPHPPAAIGGVLLVTGSLSRADALGILVWTLFTAGMAALAWSRR